MLASFRNNWVEKLLALVITLMLTFYVESVTNPLVQRAILVPLQFEGEPYNGQIRNQGQMVTVYLSGEKDRVDAVQAAEVRATVNLKDVQVGRNELPVKVRTVRNMGGLTVWPAAKTANIEVGMQTTRRLPVSVLLEGNAPAGYQVATAPSVSPSSGRVSGWKEQVDNVDGLRVRVNMENVAGNVDATFPVEAYNRNGMVVPATQVRVEPNEVRVRISLAPLPTSKTVIVSPTLEGQPPVPTQVEHITVTPAQVTLSGPPRLLARVTVIKTEPISLTEISRNTTVRTRLVVPDGLRLSESSTVSVRVEVRTPAPTPGASAD